MKNLTLTKTINGFKGAKETGTLLIFAELHEEGEYKGKNIVSWDSNPEFVPEDTKYIMDDEGRIDPVLATKKSIRHEDLELKIELAAKAGLTVQY